MGGKKQRTSKGVNVTKRLLQPSSTTDVIFVEVTASHTVQVSEDDLSPTQGSEAAFSMRRGGKLDSPLKLCINWRHGSCGNHAACTFAHVMSFFDDAGSTSHTPMGGTAGGGGGGGGGGSGPSWLEKLALSNGKVGGGGGGGSGSHSTTEMRDWKATGSLPAKASWGAPRLSEDRSTAGFVDLQTAMAAAERGRTTRRTNPNTTRNTSATSSTHGGGGGGSSGNQHQPQPAQTPSRPLSFAGERRASEMAQHKIDAARDVSADEAEAEEEREEEEEELETPLDSGEGKEAVPQSQTGERRTHSEHTGAPPPRPHPPQPVYRDSNHTKVLQEVEQPMTPPPVSHRAELQERHVYTGEECSAVFTWARRCAMEESGVEDPSAVAPFALREATSEDAEAGEEGARRWAIENPMRWWDGAAPAAEAAHAVHADQEDLSLTSPAVRARLLRALTGASPADRTPSRPSSAAAAPPPLPSSAITTTTTIMAVMGSGSAAGSVPAVQPPPLSSLLQSGGGGTFGVAFMPGPGSTAGALATPDRSAASSTVVFSTSPQAQLPAGGLSRTGLTAMDATAGMGFAQPSPAPTLYPPPPLSLTLQTTTTTPSATTSPQPSQTNTSLRQLVSLLTQED